MRYDFPIINHIDDVLPAIAGRDEFIVAEREGYKVINYNVNFADTFPPIKVAGGSAKMRAERSLHNALRRECRGIIFDSVTGNIVRRPFHKFFNVGEREETLPQHVDLNQAHHILDKLDGSMIAPFRANGEIIWGTKMGDTEVAKPVQVFVRERVAYIMFASECLRRGLTPIFEWCSRKQRIVIDHPEDRLILTAIRSMDTGAYHTHEELVAAVAHYGDVIPVVDVFAPHNDIQSFIEHTRGLQDCEGFVVRFHDGHMVKLKCDWYVQIHKAKEAILQDRNIVELILDNKLDDVKPHLIEDDVKRLDQFESAVNHAIVSRASELFALASYHARGERKDFALGAGKTMPGLDRAAVFTLWDDVSEERAFTHVVHVVRNSLGRNVKWAELRDEWFPDLVPFNS